MSKFSSYEKDKKIFDNWREFLVQEGFSLRMFQTQDGPDDEADAETAKPMLEKVYQLLEEIKNAGEALKDENKAEAWIKDKIEKLGLTSVFTKYATTDFKILNGMKERIEAGKATYGDFLDFIQEMVTYIVNKDIVDKIVDLTVGILKDKKLLGFKNLLKKVPFIGWLAEAADTVQKLISAYQLAQGLTTNNVDKFKEIMMRPDGRDPHPILSYINMNDAYENSFGTNDKLMNEFIGFFLKNKEDIRAAKDEKMDKDFIDIQFRNFLKKARGLDAAPIEKEK